MIIGEKEVTIFRPCFQMSIRLKTIFKDSEPLYYGRNLDVELALENLKSHKIPMGKDWKMVTRYHKIGYPPQAESTG